MRHVRPHDHHHDRAEQHHDPGPPPSFELAHDTTMRDEHRDRMLIEIARALEILLTEVAIHPATRNTAELMDNAGILAEARRTFEQHYG